MSDNTMATERSGSEFKALMMKKYAELGLSPNDSDDSDLYGATANIIDGGQLGLGNRILNIDGVTPMVQNKATAIVLSVPTMWSTFWPQLGQLWKACVETHATSISGVTLEYVLDKQEVPAGQDGQQLSMPTSSTRQAISPSITWKEAYGNVIFNIHRKWISDIMHPDTHISQLGSVLDEEQIANIPPWLFSTFSASMIVIQQDPLGLPDRIIDAVVINNMFPLTSSAMDFKVEPNSSEVTDRSISYTGHLTHNDNTRELGKIILTASQMHRPNYNRALVQSNVDAAIRDKTGFTKQIKEALAEFKIM